MQQLWARKHQGTRRIVSRKLGQYSRLMDAGSNRPLCIKPSPCTPISEPHCRPSSQVLLLFVFLASISETLVCESGALQRRSCGGNIFSNMAAATFCEILIAILLPPLGVFLRYSCGLEFWICLILTILGYIPGILYALYVLLV